MLTTDQLNTIMGELLTDAKPTITGPEADAFRKSIAKDIKYAKDNGLEVEFYHDFPIPDVGLPKGVSIDLAFCPTGEGGGKDNHCSPANKGKGKYHITTGGTATIGGKLQVAEKRLEQIQARLDRARAKGLGAATKGDIIDDKLNAISNIARIRNQIKGNEDYKKRAAEAEAEIAIKRAADLARAQRSDMQAAQARAAAKSKSDVKLAPQLGDVKNQIRVVGAQIKDNVERLGRMIAQDREAGDPDRRVEERKTIWQDQQRLRNEMRDLKARKNELEGKPQRKPRATKAEMQARERGDKSPEDASALTIQNTQWGKSHINSIKPISDDEEADARQGVNYTFVATTANGEKGVWKPKKGESVSHTDGDGIKRSHYNVEAFTLYKREVAASLVDRALGWGLVPEAAIVDIRKDVPGQKGDRSVGVGSLAKFAPGKTAHKWASYGDFGKIRKVPVEDGQKLSVLDYLIQNPDRHDNNYVISEDGKLGAIDNGYSFSGENQGHRSNSLTMRGNMPKSPPTWARAGVNKLIEKRVPLTSKLNKLLSDNEVNEFWTRVERLHVNLEGAVKNSNVNWYIEMPGE